MSELKPCPFCGSPATFEYAVADFSRSRVQCTSLSCGVCIHSDKDSAIKKWNNRTPHYDEHVCELSTAFGHDQCLICGKEV